MYECPNCGGNLKFDISSQQMACSYCDTHLDPYFVKKETDAVEEQFLKRRSLPVHSAEESYTAWTMKQRRFAVFAGLLRF